MPAWGYSKGYRQVIGEGRFYHGCRSVSGGIRDTGHLGPDLKGPSTSPTMIRGVGIGRTTEEVCHLVVGREEALSLPGRFEALHDPLPPSGRLMTVLRPVVQSIVLAVFDAGHYCALGSAIAGQPISDHHPWSNTLLLEQLPQQTLGCFGIARQRGRRGAWSGRALVANRVRGPSIVSCMS
jgi:hypothetical protein